MNGTDSAAKWELTGFWPTFYIVCEIYTKHGKYALILLGDLEQPTEKCLNLPS